MHGQNTSPVNVSSPSGPSRCISVDRAQFEQWCELAEEWLLSTLGSIALTRSAEMAARSASPDRHVRVMHATPPPFPAGSAPRFRVVSLALGGSRVDVYSTREPGQTPALHYAVTREPTTTRFPVVTTLPGCIVVRRDNGEIALVSAQPGLTGLRPSVTVEAVIVRALELLLGAHDSTRHARNN